MSIALASSPSDNSIFDQFADVVSRRFNRVAGADDRQPLFTVDAGDLYATYLDGFSDPGERQHHTCACCRQFIERFGNLVTIGDDGRVSSAMWDAAELPALFQPVASALARAVERGKVTGVFISNEKRWGVPVTGEWHHFSVVPQSWRLHRDRVAAPHQVVAQKKQDFGTLSHGLADFSRDTVAAAVNLLNAEALYRSEKVMGPAQFLLGLHDAIAPLHGERRRNIIWKAIATAPVGFATPRSSMVGTLLEDIASGMAINDVKRRFADKMHPLQYQRPQAAPAAGNIAQAEAIVEKLGLEPALHRRFARIEEVKLIWSPTATAPAKIGGGVFGHLLDAPKVAQKHDVTRQSITWVKFASTVLPKAKSIHVLTHAGMNLAGVVTAVNPDAPPLLQWDYEDARNPVSWYVWNGGSLPSSWGLTTGEWVEATGVMLKPSMWGDDLRQSHQGSGAIVILKEAKETRDPGLVLFPECLRSDLHSVRATIEAFSRSRKAEGAEEGSANGLMIGKEGSSSDIRVTTDLGTIDYKIDRWD